MSKHSTPLNPAAPPSPLMCMEERQAFFSCFTRRRRSRRRRREGEGGRKEGSVGRGSSYVVLSHSQSQRVNQVSKDSAITGSNSSEMNKLGVFRPDLLGERSPWSRVLGPVRPGVLDRSEYGSDRCVCCVPHREWWVCCVLLQPPSFSHTQLHRHSAIFYSGSLAVLRHFVI